MGCGCKKGGDAPAINFNRKRRASKFSEAQLAGHEEFDDHKFDKEKDSLVNFEKKFPLYKIHVNAWCHKLQKTGNTHVTLQNLKSMFASPTFQGKFEKDSPLHQVLKSLPKCSEDQFYVRSLELLGIAWCSGTVQDRAVALFDILQPANQARDCIAATDNDFPEVIDTLIEIHSLVALRKCSLFPELNPMSDTLPHVKQMQNVFNYCMSESDEKHEYARKAIRYMRTSEIDDNKELTGFIWQVYGYESKFSQDEFIDKVQTGECSWIFDGKKVRIRLNTFLDVKSIEELDANAD